MVAHVKVKLVNEDFLGEFYFSKNPVALARQLMKEGRYREACECYMAKEGSDAAEEMFDVTNNPSRQDERERLYGRSRSVSVGDIVSVNGERHLCASVGWVALA